MATDKMDLIEKDILDLTEKYTDVCFLVVVYSSDNDYYNIFGNGCPRCAAERVAHWALSKDVKHDALTSEILKEIKH